MSTAESPDAEDATAKTRRRRPRTLFIAAGVLALVVAAGAWIWFARVPTYRGGLEPGESYGIDVSGHQKTIDWSSVRKDGIDFAYIKATEGGDFVDDHFATNWAQAHDAGVKRGAYHFFTLCRPGANQADNFLRTVPRDADALPPVVDLEFVGNCAGRPSREALLHELTVFVDRVESATGQRIVLYVMDDFDEQYGVTQTLTRQRWVRSLFRRPDTDDWLIWQTSDVAAVAGIEGGVDLDVMKSSP